MVFRTEDELLRHFVDGGCMVDRQSNTAYISDVNADGEFFGIMVAGNMPDEECGSVVDACQYALGCIPAPGTIAPNRMDFMEAPGYWFSEIAETVIGDPDRFLFEEEA